jgi:hypothetical protein
MALRKYEVFIFLLEKREFHTIWKTYARMRGLTSG